MVAFKKQIQTQWSFHICSTYGGCPITILFVSIKLHFSRGRPLITSALFQPFLTPPSLPSATISIPIPPPLYDVSNFKFYPPTPKKRTCISWSFKILNFLKNWWVWELISSILIDGFTVVNFPFSGQKNDEFPYPLFKIDGFLGTLEPIQTRRFQI